MATTTSTQIPAPVQTFYNRVLLKRALPYLAHGLFGQTSTVSMNSGDQPRWRRYSSLTAAVAPLSEGVTPTAQQMAKTDVDGQLYTYGSFVEITDYVQYTSQDKVLTVASELLGENMGESLDLVYRGTLVGGTSVYRQGNVAQASITAKLTSTSLDYVLRALEVNNAKYWREKPIIGTDKVGTSPIAPAYFAIVDPYTVYDLRGVLTTSFIETYKYANPNEAVPNEVGSYKNLRFVQSTAAKVYADSGGSATVATTKYTTATSACDVHAMLIFGMDAYGLTPLSGKSNQMIVKAVGAGDDPLDQRSTAGWKAITGIKILNDNFMYRYEYAVSR
jgi:N4-gp56 family major capsid protein